MIAQRQATKAAAAGSRTAFKTPGMRHSVRVRVSTEEVEAAAPPPKVDFMPNTQAVSTHKAAHVYGGSGACYCLVKNH
jgi:hypothetical protein